MPKPLTASLAVLFLAAFAAWSADGLGRFDFERLPGEIVLARDGAPRAVIVAPRDSPAPVRFAAEEIKEHLDLMTGGDFPIAESPPETGVYIRLGDSPDARAAGIDIDSIARDGYAVRTTDRAILIAGRDDATARGETVFAAKGAEFPRAMGRTALLDRMGTPVWDFERGTLYGVYRFLEELGVRWFFAGEKGRVVPQKPDLAIGRFRLTEEPHYILRHVGIVPWEWRRLESRDVLGMADPQEFEELGWGPRAQRLWLLRMRHSSEWFAFNHRPPRMEWEQRFGEDHPEWFALRENGKRDLAPESGRTGHLCYTSEGVYRQTLEDIEAYLAGKTGAEAGLSDRRARQNQSNRGWPPNAAYGRTVSLLPHDSFRGCFCPRCARLVHPELGREALHSELVWQFVERVAREAEARHPDLLLTNLAYASYRTKPSALASLPDNVVVGFVARHFMYVEEEAYAGFAQGIRQWAALNKRPVLFWMHHLYRFRRETRLGAPMTIPRWLAKMVRDLGEHGNMMFMQQDYDSAMMEHLNAYVLQKALYNPNLDADELLRDYAESFYGPAGPTALAIIDDIEAKSTEIARTRAGNVVVWRDYFTAGVMAGYRAGADRMAETTRGTPHEEAARLFSRWVIGTMERGRARYVRQIEQVDASGEADLRAVRAGAVALDGRLDEPAWANAPAGRFRSNATGEPIAFESTVRVLFDEANVYFGFECRDPKSLELPKAAGDVDYVEIFLDPQHDHDSFYQILIDTEGRLRDWYFEGGGEPADATWESGARFGVRRYSDRWVAEIAVPVRSVAPEGGLAGKVWGANMCRTQQNPPREADRFATWSPLLRGRFAQPDLFGQILFAE